jgi:hypothetical protein
MVEIDIAWSVNFRNLLLKFPTRRTFAAEFETCRATVGLHVRGVDFFTPGNC